MATTISPSVGQGLVWTQQGPGTTPGFSAIDDRRAALSGAQEGVIASNSTEANGWACRQRTAGANNQVEIVANVACARVQGDSVTQQGLYTVASHSAVILETLSPADATNPRIDQVILEALDNVHDASGLNLARTRVLTGTPTAGATLDNRLGAVALPSNAMRLGDLLVPANGAGTVTLSNSQIRDRRLDARGAEYAYQRTAGNIALSGTSYQNLSTTDAALGARLECSGAPLHIHIVARLSAPASAVDSYAALYQDGTILSGGERYLISIGAGGSGQMNTWWTTTPAAGSHYFDIYVRMTTTGGAVIADTTQGCVVEFQEVVRQNTKRNTITSG